ncbi:MAG TPA: radical SAM family heme chaperone HemW, partial [Bacillota bacterium]
PAGRIERYLAALTAEIRLQARRPSVRAAVFRTVHFGGGTPSLLEPDQFLRLWGVLREHFALAPDAEIALEANPDHLNEARLAAWLAAGVTRLSIGVQAVQARLLRTLGRHHSWEAVVAGYRRARALGFTNVNLDLMFGLPGQTLEDWDETLSEVLALAPDLPEHLSCYGLQVEPGTLFSRWQREGRLPLPGDDSERRMYEHACARLAAAGYQHYEISNFARPGFASRHNVNYWAFGAYLGVGAGAASHWQGERWSNERDLGAYSRSLSAGRLPIAEHDPRDERTRMAEMLMLGTRLVEGLPHAWFREVFGRRPDEVFADALAQLEQRGLLCVEDDRIVLTAEGRLLANEVWLALL